MRLTTKLLAALAAVSSCGALAATGYVTVEHQRITNSTIDATAIGNVSPSTGYFSNFGANTGFLNQSLAVGTGYSVFSLTPGTSAPVRRGITWGADPAGDVTVWLNSTENNPLLQIKDGDSGKVYGSIGANGLNILDGATITGTVSTNNVGATGNAGFGGSLTVGNGATITGTISTNTVGATGNGTFGGKVTATGGFVGNASSATQLAANPTTCVNSRMIGISANGNAVCTLSGYSIPVNAPGGNATGGGSYNTAPTTINFGGFSDGSTDYAVQCNGTGSSDPRAAILGISNFTATSFVVTTVTEGSVAVSYSGFTCNVTHG